MVYVGRWVPAGAWRNILIFGVGPFTREATVLVVGGDREAGGYTFTGRLPGTEPFPRAVVDTVWGQ